MAHSHLEQMAQDLEAARRNTTFPVEVLTRLLQGGSTVLEKLNKVKSVVDKEPLLNKFSMAFLSRQEQLDHAVRVAERMIEIAEEQRWSEDEFAIMARYLDMLTPLSLHYTAFMAVIKAQGTPEQIEKWYTAAQRHAILGCYAQTELGHGSNVAGLGTIATLDTQTDEFVIHSPDLTAAKWWIGGLGTISTHAMVQAQLVISGKSYGPHLFIVPVRSPVDHKVVEGVQVGDIGPKAYNGFATMDNGYALFDHVRIPRENMLMRFSKVTRDGQYVAPAHNKLSYGSMVKLRVDIVADAGWKLAKATTIAIRYCTVRRQFNDASAPNGLEKQVITYSSVQHRLLPLLSTAYGLNISSGDLNVQFRELQNKLAHEDTRMLPEIHATSCALKSWGTRRSTDGIEECRKAMGGHGYSSFSGLSDLFASFVPSNTYEGDNYVLSQQVARFLLKQLKHVSKDGRAMSTTADYLELLKKGNMDAPLEIQSASMLLDPRVQLEMFGTRASRLVADLAQKLQAGRAWSDLNMECWELNLAHAEHIILRQMVTRVEELQRSSEYASVVSAVQNMTNLFCFSIVRQTSLASFLVTSTISSKAVNLIEDQLRVVLAEVADQAIGLTDAFGFSDRELTTVLGQKDGRAYEAFWTAVQTNPLNSQEGRDQFGELAKRILHRGDNMDYIKTAKL
ncbi:hypothetical protein DFQ28_009880 [Apophysomyces sp. BC1034]|nr:hypothetical protein DFQ30_009439 [Apophysomyces sp. BC1015]KAG0181590.1 hypothetical protein DFQ29_007850 [Apophysomyces sp. BC1021]KAG0192207.1 hypothetical protein DFQ28_009880 [Apophysomyces sp. BC1034]